MRTRQLHLITIALLSALTLSACSGNGEPAPVASSTPIESAAPAVAEHAHARGDGTLASIQGVSLELLNSEYVAGKEQNIQFTLNQLDTPIMDYVLVHEFPVHVVVVDRQLGSYQHLHPTMGKNGIWQLPITFPAAGDYRIVTDFTLVEGNEDINYVLGSDFTVTGKAAEPFILPAPTESVTVDGYVVTVSGSVSATDHTMMMFTVTKDGKPVMFEPWLGTSGHLVAIRQDDLAYAHMHPDNHHHDTVLGGDAMNPEVATPTAATTAPDATSTASASSSGSMMDESMPGMLHFKAEFPSGGGTYRLFLQFKADGKVRTAAFTANVA